MEAGQYFLTSPILPMREGNHGSTTRSPKRKTDVWVTRPSKLRVSDFAEMRIARVHPPRHIGEDMRVEIVHCPM